MNQPLREQNPDGMAILGGSFDPIHWGHIWMAQAAYEQLPVAKVRWMPAATSPLKESGTHANASQRLEMLRLAIGASSCFQADERELKREGVSYTVDTLNDLHAEQPDRKIFLIVGADNLACFDQWRQPENVLRLCTLAVVARGGSPSPDWSTLQRYLSTDEVEWHRQHQIRMPQIDLSSSLIRERVAAGLTIRHLVPASVAAFISASKLYQASTVV
ncbi:MAG: nicotinate (nicotinamide) nucleotide adenylyltransferase [Planctomycetota bacterium]